jgi:MFS family permease
VVIGASLAPSYAGFTACRTLQGFFNTAPQVIGLTIIHDMFFFHERARKINIWAFSFLVGPYAGPFVAGFLIEKINWRQDFGVLAAFYAFSTILVVLFGDETLYDRENPKNNSMEAKGFSRKLQLLTGIAGIKAQGRPTLKTVFKDIFVIAPLPYLILPC